MPILVNIYAAADHDALVCSLRDLELRLLNQPGSGEALWREAHGHDDPESLTHFSIERTGLDDVNLYVNDGEKLLLLSAVIVTGPITL